MAGYYRRFCPNFAKIAAPITDLLGKQKQFVWSEECDNAFKQLKTMLSSSPVLAAPDFTKQFKLAVDACDIGAGAVLFQEDNESLDHPVSYFSKKFNSHQRNYSTVEQEALALILSLKHFDIYVKANHHEVIVYTDNYPLTFIHRVKHTNQRILRWSLMIQGYGLKICHLPGSANVFADTLSRSPSDD